MARVERSTSSGGKRYLTDKAVVFNDVEAKNIIVGGKDNTSGLIQVLDENGTLTVNIDKSGVTLSNGADIIGENGVLSTIFIKPMGIGFLAPNLEDAYCGEFLGYNTGMGANWGNFQRFDFYIPSNFTVSAAYITLVHTPIHWVNGGDYNFYGYVRNVKAYTETGNFSISAAYESTFAPFGSPTLTEIYGAFGASGYTAPSPVTPYPSSTTTSINIASSIISGANNRIVIKSSDAVPTFNVDMATNATNIGTKTGYVEATLNITGFTQ